MGQAKRRGTFEQRKEVAIAESNARAEQLRIEEAAYEEDRQRRRLTERSESHERPRSHRSPLPLGIAMMGVGLIGVTPR